MTTKIIPFRRPEPSPQTNHGFAQKSPAERTEALPQWAKELDVEWIFKAADQRSGGRPY